MVKFKHSLFLLNWMTIFILLSGSQGKDLSEELPLRALTPSTEFYLEKVGVNLQPTYFIKNYYIQFDQMIMDVCNLHQRETCFTLEFTDPQHNCNGFCKTDTWCITIKDDVDHGCDTEFICKIFKENPKRKCWNNLGTSKDYGNIETNDQKSSYFFLLSKKLVTISNDVGLPLLYALLIFIIPLGIGILFSIIVSLGYLGFKLNYKNILHILIGLTLLVCLLGVWLHPYFVCGLLYLILIASYIILYDKIGNKLKTFIILSQILFMFLFNYFFFNPNLEIGYPDLVVIWLCFYLGSTIPLVYRKIEWRFVCVQVTRLSILLLIIEILTRFIAPTPPAFPPVRNARLFIPNITLPEHGIEKERYQGLYSSNYEKSYKDRKNPEYKNLPRVVHVGDSLVEGLGVKNESTFVHLLGMFDDNRIHVNLGVSGAAPDYYYAKTVLYLKKNNVDHVILYFFEGNDYFINERYTFCNNNSLLQYSEDKIAIRCMKPRWATVAFNALSFSPPPYFMRVSTYFSYSMKHILAIYENEKPRFTSVFNNDLSQREKQLHQIFHSFKKYLEKRGVIFTVIILPLRSSHIEEKQKYFNKMPARDDQENIREILDKNDILWIDATPMISNVISKIGEDKFFLPNNDVHFSEIGHEYVANWLIEILSNRQ